MHQLVNDGCVTNQPKTQQLQTANLFYCTVSVEEEYTWLSGFLMGCEQGVDGLLPTSPGSMGQNRVQAATMAWQASHPCGRWTEASVSCHLGLSRRQITGGPLARAEVEQEGGSGPLFVT